MLQSPNDTRHIKSDQDALSVPEGALQPGQVLQNRYRILGILGVGGMGAVYQARDMHFEDVPRLCAVKEMINLAQDQQLREQTFKNFKREASLLATLSHPAIPQIFDFFSFGDRAYLVMEHIQGKDLEAILATTSQFLPVEQIVQWGIEICDVLEYLHNHKPEPIVFRDMKPSNVMIDHHRRVRLIDFGIAKTFQMGQPGTMIGTEGYSPPEQYKGEASPAADIYALGATLHHLLTRRDPRLEPPFSFDQKPISAYNPQVPDALAAVIMRSLAYDPKERYASAAAMKQALEAVMAGSITVAVPPQPSAPPTLAPEVAADPTPQARPAAVPSAPPPAAAAPAAVSTVLPIWSFKVEDAVRSTPLVRDDTVYFGSYDNNLWALDAKSGKLVWKCPTEGGIGSSPIYSGGSLFIGSSDRRLYAVDAKTGRVQWSHKTDGKIFSTPHVAAGMVFVGSDDGYLYALKPGVGSGRQVWAFPLMHPIRSSPVVYEDRIYVGSDNGDFVCLDFNGELVWRFQSRRRILSSPIIKDGVVYFGSDDWNIYALDIEQGMSIWRFRTRGEVVSKPAFGDGQVYFGSADGHVYAVDALGGREMWRYEVGKPVTSSPFFHREAIYIGAVDGAVYCLHSKSGELLWRFQTQGPVLSSPTVADDIVYIGSDDWHVYALPG